MKWSDELRRERLHLFGGNSADKVSKTESKQDKYTESLPLPAHIEQAADVWPYIAKLTEYVENKTGYTLPALFTQNYTDNRHYAKAFAVIMRYGFGIKRSVITTQFGTTKQKLDSVFNMYRDALYYTPQFREKLDELLEQLARF